MIVLYILGYFSRNKQNSYLNLNWYSSSTSFLECRAGGGKGLVDLVNQLTFQRCTVFYSMAAAGRELQSGIVRCQKEFCLSVVLALRCL